MAPLADTARVGYVLRDGRPVARKTASEHLAWEADQPERHEFIGHALADWDENGDQHDATVRRLNGLLRRHLQGADLRMQVVEVELPIGRTGRFHRPDLLVAWAASDASTEACEVKPLLVIEVLSTWTAAFDRGEKFADYRLLPTLAEYLLVDVKTRRCDLYRKRADELWVLHPTDADEAVHLASVDLTVPPEALWADVEAEGKSSGASSETDPDGKPLSA